MSLIYRAPGLCVDKCVLIVIRFMDDELMPELEEIISPFFLDLWTDALICSSLLEIAFALSCL